MKTTEQLLPLVDAINQPVQKNNSSNYLISVITLLVLLMVWYLISRFELVSPLLLPSPKAVVEKFWPLVTEGYMDVSLLQHTLASVGRISLALLIVIITAIPLGVAIGKSRLLQGIFDPIIEFYRPIPPLAYLPLLVIWFGIGELPKILLIYLAIFAPVVIAVRDAVTHVNPNRLRAAQSLGASQWQQIRYIVIPSILPDIFKGLRIGLGVGWSTLVAAELVAATQGLGFMVQTASQYLQTDIVILGIFIIAIIAFISELLLRFLQQKLVPWQKFD